MDEPDWQAWRSFLAVLRGGSLSAAARALRLTQPTLGRHIAALEQALGLALFTRSADGLQPTDSALDLRAHAEAMEAAAAALLRAASGGAGELRGIVRLAASEVMGEEILPPMLGRFQARHPGVAIDLVVSNRTQDLLRQEADLAVRNVAPTQAALMVRRLGTIGLRLFAHRDYLAAHGTPATPADLPRHRLIGRAEHAAAARELFAQAPQFSFSCNTDAGLLAALRAGLGIGYCQIGIGRRAAELVAVLPEITVAHIGVWLAMHEDLRPVRRVRALFDHLATELAAEIAGQAEGGRRVVGPESSSGMA